MGRIQIELSRRIWFTLGVLVVYRLGTYIPIPGIDPQMMADVFSGHGGGILGMFDLFTGGAFGRTTILALGVLPYLVAMVIMDLMIVVSPQLRALKQTGEAGRKKIYQYIRYGTVLLCIFQSYGIAVGLESSGGGAVIDPGQFFRFSTVATLTGGTIFLMWLCEQIDHRGIGNGASLIIFAGIVANLPAAIAGTVEVGRTGELAGRFHILLILMSVVVVTSIVFMEKAQRRIEVRYPKRQVGGQMFGGETSHLPLMLNTAGLVPPVFAAVLLAPLSVAHLSTPGGAEWLESLTTLMGRGQPGYLLIYAGLIAFLAIFYAAIVYGPADTAKNLQKHGGFIPTIRPGRNTADYLSFVLTRVTTVGAAFLAIVCVLPEILLARYQVSFYFSGTSLLILVVVIMDTVGRINSHILAGGPPPPPGGSSVTMALRPGTWWSMDAQGDVRDEDRTDTAAVK